MFALLHSVQKEGKKTPPGLVFLWTHCLQHVLFTLLIFPCLGVMAMMSHAVHGVIVQMATEANQTHACVLSVRPSLNIHVSYLIGYQ